MQVGDRQRERGFQSGDAERGALEFHLFLVGGVGRMVGGDGVHRAVGERSQDSFKIGGRAQRGIHLVIAVIVTHIVVGQREMMRRHFEGDARFGALATAHTLQGVRGGKMRDVQAGVGNLHRELHVTLDDRGFGSRSHAAQSETEGTRARVHRTILGHPSVFGMLHDGEIQLPGQNQRLAHDAVIEDGLAIVGDGDCSRGLERAEVGERGTLA